MVTAFDGAIPFYVRSTDRRGSQNTSCIDIFSTHRARGAPITSRDHLFRRSLCRPARRGQLDGHESFFSNRKHAASEIPIAFRSATNRLQGNFWLLRSPAEPARVADTPSCLRNSFFGCRSISARQTPGLSRSTPRQVL